MLGVAPGPKDRGAKVRVLGTGCEVRVGSGGVVGRWLLAGLPRADMVKFEGLFCVWRWEE